MPFPPLPESLTRALIARGYAEPTAVQSAVLGAPPGDLLVSARTGSGKTVAFGLRSFEALDPAQAKPPQALIIAPTRELAIQVATELRWLYAQSGLKVISCVGGMDPRAEARALYAGAHVVVGTPGRLCDHLDRRSLDLSAVRVVVLDEADEMLDMGFKEELETLLDATPESRQTLLFSATLPTGIEALAKQYQRNAQRLAVNSEEAHADIRYRAALIVGREREAAIVNVLRLMNSGRALVFCATRDGVAHLHASLTERGLSAVALSGDFSQAERSRALASLRDGRASVLVATDVAARGLDLPHLDLVIHADIPNDPAALVHRSGRTGRAGRKGTAVLIVPFQRERQARRLLQMARLEATWSGPPTGAEVREKDQARLLESLKALVAEETSPEDLALARKLLEELPAEQLVAQLVQQRRTSLPAPEDLVETEGALSEAPVPTKAKAPRPSPAAPRPGRGVWFRINLGRRDNADPRWLIPIICQRGSVIKAEIGAIHVKPQETWFEIAPDAAQRFAQNSARPDRRNPGVFFALVQ